MAAIELGNTTLVNDASIISYYKLENTTDTKALHNLTNNGSAAFNPAKFNNGGDLGTTNTTKYFNTGNNMGIDGGAVSIVGWLKANEAPAATWRLLSQENTGNSVQYLIDYDGGTLQANRVKVSVSNNIAGFSTSLGTSLFHHIALTYDTVTLLLYLDGVQVASKATSGNGSGSIVNDFVIGASPNTNDKSAAIFDDVAIFSRALTAAEISLLALGANIGFLTTNSKFW